MQLNVSNDLAKAKRRWTEKSSQVDVQQCALSEVGEELGDELARLARPKAEARRRARRRRRRRRRACALIKSNNPHLAGGEQNVSDRGTKRLTRDRMEYLMYPCKVYNMAESQFVGSSFPEKMEKQVLRVGTKSFKQMGFIHFKVFDACASHQRLEQHGGYGFDGGSLLYFF